MSCCNGKLSCVCCHLGGNGTEEVTKVVEAEVGNAGPSTSFVPGFPDGRFFESDSSGENEGLVWQFDDLELAEEAGGLVDKGDGAGKAIFGVF